MIHWVAGTNDSSIKCLMFQVLFFFIISCKILCKNLFIFLFLYNFTKIKKQSFECLKSKAATHCFIFNQSKLYLDHQTLGWWVVRPNDPAYYIEDCRIFGRVSTLAHSFLWAFDGLSFGKSLHKRLISSSHGRQMQKMFHFFLSSSYFRLCLKVS